MRSSQERQFVHENVRAEQKEVRDFLKFQAIEAVQEEHEAHSRLTEAESHMRVLLTTANMQ